MSSEAETQAPPAAAAPLPAAVATAAAVPLAAAAAPVVPDSKASNGTGGGGGGGGNGTNGGLGSAAPPAGGDKKVIGEGGKEREKMRHDGRGEEEGAGPRPGWGLSGWRAVRALLPPSPPPRLARLVVIARARFPFSFPFLLFTSLPAPSLSPSLVR